MRNTENENLAEHTAEVAMVAHILCFIGNKYFGKNYDADRAVSLALYHDVPEIFTGDLPTPIKYYNKETKESYSEIEKNYLDRMISSLPKELADEYKTYFIHDQKDAEELKMVKAADKLCAYIKCIKECEAGNNDFRTAKETTEKFIDKMNIDEVNYFRKTFLSAFSLTIDEM